MASIRHERRIAASAERVWSLIRRPESIVDWFPGIVDVSVEGSSRTITTAMGMVIHERILVCDDAARRFAYSIVDEGYRLHVGTIDVIELGVDESLCVYSTTAEPDTLALIISGGTVGALERIEELSTGERGD